MFGVVGGGNASTSTGSVTSTPACTATRERPIPAGRVSPQAALIYGLVISVAGLAILELLVNRAAMFTALAGWVSYVLIYTPAKQKTPASTLIGAFPGVFLRWSAGPRREAR